MKHTVDWRQTLLLSSVGEGNVRGLFSGSKALSSQECYYFQKKQHLWRHRGLMCRAYKYIYLTSSQKYQAKYYFPH